MDAETFTRDETVDALQESVVELGLVSKAMDKLSDDQKQILIMICGQEMKYEEVARTLNIPIGTVRSRLSRARDNLQKIMKRDAAPEGMPALASDSASRVSAFS